MASVLTEEEIPLTFSEEKDEDNLSMFALEDLIKEYNHKILNDSPFMCTYKRPLSLSMPSINGDQLTIRAMTEGEIATRDQAKRSEQNRRNFDEVLNEHASPLGILSHIPDLAGAVTLRELVSEIGLTGKVIWKETGGKIYVILKGHPGLRYILRGTRYLNTHPEIVRLGLAKVSVGARVMAGFKTSIYVYGAVKAVEGLALYFQGELTPKFFADIPGGATKAVISGALGAVAAGAVIVLLGAPVSVGIGVAIVVGIGVGMTLDFLDKKIGFTETISNAAQKLWKNLESWGRKFKSSGSSYRQPGTPILFPYLGDPLLGFQFPGLMASNQQIVPYGNQFVYTA